ncbi:MAG: hypothetical protein V4532_07755 [Pseudomonadota bacterium]
MSGDQGRADGSMRLLLEFFCIVAGTEVAVMFLLPILAPGVAGWQEAMLDVSMLTLVAGPLAAWRAHRLIHREQVRKVLETHRARLFTWLWSLGIFVIGLALSLGGAWGLRNNLNEVAQMRFDRLSAQLQSTIESRFSKHHGHGGRRADP